MAFREVTMLEVIEVVRMWLSQRSRKEIARQLSVDVKTVRRYVMPPPVSAVSSRYRVLLLSPRSSRRR